MPLPVYDTSANQAAPLGSELLIGAGGAGRVFRYAKNGPGALTVGTVLQGPQPDATHANLTCAAQAVGKSDVTVTLDRAGIVLINEYKQGYIYTNDAAGAGYLYDVASHPGAEGEDSTLKVKIRDHTVVALTTSSQATLVHNPYSGVNKPFGDPWDIVLGVTPVAVPANEYFWCQVRGPAVVLQHGGLFAGRGVMASQTIAGAAEVLKQVIPIRREMAAELRGGQGATEGSPFNQKGVEPPYDYIRSGRGSEYVLTEVSGKATIPERVIGYCINPRVSTEHALIYLTLS